MLFLLILLLFQILTLTPLVHHLCRFWKLYVPLLPSLCLARHFTWQLIIISLFSYFIPKLLHRIGRLLPLDMLTLLFVFQLIL